MKEDRKIQREYKMSMGCGVKISKEKNLFCGCMLPSVPQYTVHVSLLVQIHEVVSVRARVCVSVCVCVLEAVSEWEDLGGKSWSRKLLEVILRPTADFTWSLLTNV